MKLSLYSLALLFCLFPYTQVLDIEAYNQPYALVFSAIAAIVAFPTLRYIFPNKDFALLGFLAAFGILGFLATCFPNPTPQEFKYLLIYVSPVIFAAVAFGIAYEYPVLSDRILVFAACAWIGTGVIQTIISPTFMTQFTGSFGESAEIVIDSGRGTLGLAPEPTHFGFHMVIIATALALVGGRNILSMACLATALLIAKSSSAVLALGLGSVIFLALYTPRGWMFLAALIPGYYLLGVIVQMHILPENTRVVALLTDFYDSPWYMLTSDYSANSRLGGIYVGIKESVSNTFFPAGLSHEHWLEQMDPIMADIPWLLGLSDAGIPSGILVVVYQLGIFGLVVMAALLRRMMTHLHSHYETLLICTVVFVFFSQYYISTPGFGMIYGFALARRVRAKRLTAPPRSKSAGNPAMPLPSPVSAA